MFGKKGPKTETGADHVDVGKVLQEIAGVRAQLYATGAVDRAARRKVRYNRPV